MEPNEILFEQLSDREYRVSHNDFVVTMKIENPADPDKGIELLAELFNSYNLLQEERKASAKLTIAFGVIFNDLTDRLGYTPDMLIDNEGANNGDSIA